MELKASVWSCTCGAKISPGDLKSLLSKEVKRTLETARLETALSVDPGTAVRRYCDILDSLYRLTSHPWSGLVMPERMLWKAIRTMNGNKLVL